MMSFNLKKGISFILVFCFLFQSSGISTATEVIDLSGFLKQHFVPLDKFRPLHLRFLEYNLNQNNFRLLLDKGDQLKNQKTEELKDLTQTLLNYFFVGLSLPNSSFWVNLRPDAPDNIIDNYLSQTDLGKILLEQDLQLKKDTAKLTSPESPEGKTFWTKLYQKAEELFGYTPSNIPFICRPWIVPGEVIIRETNPELTSERVNVLTGSNPQTRSPANPLTPSAYIYKATLKVMLEEDYLSTDTHGFKNTDAHRLNPRESALDPRLSALNEYATQLLRELIIPKLTKEINLAKRYAPLRQVFYSLILAQWFKKRFNQSVSGLTSERVSEFKPANSFTRSPVNLIDSRNLTHLTTKAPYSVATYFNQYKTSLEKGEYNLKVTQSSLFGSYVKSYVSGGVNLGSIFSPQQTDTHIILGNLTLNFLDFIKELIGIETNSDGNFRVIHKPESSKASAFQIQKPKVTVTLETNEPITIKANTVGELLEVLSKTDPKLQSYSKEDLFNRLNIFVNGNLTQSLDTPLKQGDEVDILFKMGGGADEQENKSASSAAVGQKPEKPDIDNLSNPKLYRDNSLEKVIETLNGLSAEELKAQNVDFVISLILRLVWKVKRDKEEFKESLVKDAMKQLIDKVLPDWRINSAYEQFVDFVYSHFYYQSNVLESETRKKSLAIVYPQAKRLLDDTSPNLFDLLLGDNPHSLFILKMYIRAVGIIAIQRYSFLQNRENLNNILDASPVALDFYSEGVRLFKEDGEIKPSYGGGMNSGYTIGKDYLKGIKETQDVKLLFQVLFHELGHNILRGSYQSDEAKVLFFIYLNISELDYKAVDEFFADLVAKDLSVHLGWSAEKFLNFVEMDSYFELAQNNGYKAEEWHIVSRAQIKLLQKAGLDMTAEELLAAIVKVLPFEIADMSLLDPKKEKLSELVESFIQEFKKNSRMFRDLIFFYNKKIKEIRKKIKNIIKKIIPENSQWLFEILYQRFPWVQTKKFAEEPIKQPSELDPSKQLVSMIKLNVKLFVPVPLPAKTEFTSSAVEKENPDGLCLTPDSLIYLQSPISNLRSEIKLAPLIEVKPGDLVLSLNQETGKLEPHRVNALLEMGVKPVYRITTQSGKTLKTTLNHPYLTKNGWRKLKEIDAGEEIAVAEDARLSFDRKSRFSHFTDAYFGFGNYGECSTENFGFVSLEKREDYRGRIFNSCGFDFYKDDSRIRANGKTIDIAKVSIKGKQDQVFSNAKFDNLFINESREILFQNGINFITGSSEGSYSGNEKAFVSKEFHLNSLFDKDILIFDDSYSVMDTSSNIFRGNLWVTVSNDSFNSITCLNEFQNHINRDSRSLDTGFAKADVRVNRNSIFQRIISHYLYLQKKIYHSFSFLSRLFSIAQAEAGETIEDTDIFWDKIVFIEYIGNLQVYDIEVDGTHNFVAEGILAHNTAIKKSSQSPVPSNQREKDNTETPISNSEGKDINPGGIDLRNIPIIQQPLTQGNNVGRRTSNIPDSDELETTRNLVELAVEYKHIPEIQRLKQWITLSLREDKFYQELNKILSCLVGILRLQEEDFLSTPESLTKLLSLLEQNKPPEELISSLDMI